MLEVKKEIEVTIIDLDYKGDGIAIVDDIYVYIKGALKDELVRALVLKVKEKFAIAKLIKVIKPSKDRLKDSVLLGSLNMSHLSFDMQLKWQSDITLKSFNKAFNKDFEIAPIITDNNNSSYRNKVTFHIMNNKILTLGLYDYNETRLVKTDRLDIANDNANILVKKLNDAKITVDFNILKHLMIKNNSENKLLVTLVSTRRSFIGLHEILDLLDLDKNVLGVTLNIKDDVNKILGNKTYTLRGQDFLNENNLIMTTKSFMQVNFKVQDLVFEEIRKHILGKSIIDAYSGIGSISYNVLDNNKKLTLIDNNPENIKLAKEIFKDKEVNLLLGNAEDLIDELTCDTLLVDPPRQGLDKKFVNSLLNKKIKRIIYMSCNLQSLIRDTKLLANKYEIKEITPIKMFPETNSFETLVILDLIN
ncbi:class I SAM-dependent RNA methyltransferase [Haploplasma modicum]|uniref:class I SAM-dependent RNA methyltransferase n=1 Tax=Haploplasma modicum TaxID=2150 RepID=UPI00214B8254|nr:TRAM domain-containing protein [Haploplasma modicum]MCR1809331.1 TRAM domain-containing protein [Haploplasma modicum]